MKWLNILLIVVCVLLLMYCGSVSKSSSEADQELEWRKKCRTRLAALTAEFEQKCKARTDQTMTEHNRLLHWCVQNRQSFGNSDTIRKEFDKLHGGHKEAISGMQKEYEHYFEKNHPGSREGEDMPGDLLKEYAEQIEHIASVHRSVNYMLQEQAEVL